MRRTTWQKGALVSLAPAYLLLGQVAQAEDAAAGKPEAIEEVVITGSLIQRPNNTSVSPITTVSA